MTENESHNEVDLPEDLAEALRENPEAATIWNNLSAAHRRGHVIAIERTEDPEVRQERVKNTIEHLFDKHSS